MMWPVFSISAGCISLYSDVANRIIAIFLNFLTHLLEKGCDMSKNAEIRAINNSGRNKECTRKAMKALRTFGFLLTVTGLIACKPREWKQYSHPEDGVSFSMPSEPLLHEKTFEGQVGNGTTRSYRTDSSAFGGALYEVSVSTYPKNLDVQVSLDNFKNTLSDNGTKKIENDHPVTLQGYSGEEFDLVTDKVHERLRYYVVNRRVVGVFVIVNAADSLPADMDRFFNSVQLTDATTQPVS